MRSSGRFCPTDSAPSSHLGDEAAATCETDCLALASDALGCNSGFCHSSDFGILVSRIPAAARRSGRTRGEAAGDAGSTNYGYEAAHGKGKGSRKRSCEGGEHFMRKIAMFVVFLASIVTLGSAQDVKMPVNLDKLAAKASETTEVTLNGR